MHTAERQRETKQKPVKKVNPSDGNVKKQIGNVVKSLMHYRFQSLGEYRALLSLYNITVEEAKGEARGREYHGLVYSATDDKGNKVGNPFKSSRFGKTVGYEALEKHVAFSKEQIREKKLATHTKDAVTAALRQTTIRAKFIAALKTKGIDTVLRETDAGRIYGATFIDHNTGCVMNGSRLGKELSANVLQEHFASPNADTRLPNFAPPYEPTSLTEQVSQQEVSSGGGLDLLSFDTQGTDSDEEAFIRQMKRKKKKKQHPNI